jgi:hypothetical protein
MRQDHSEEAFNQTSLGEVLPVAETSCPGSAPEQGRPAGDGPGEEGPPHDLMRRGHHHVPEGLGLPQGGTA